MDTDRCILCMMIGCAEASVAEPKYAFDMYSEFALSAPQGRFDACQFCLKGWIRRFVSGVRRCFLCSCYNFILGKCHVQLEK